MPRTISNAINEAYTMGLTSGIGKSTKRCPTRGWVGSWKPLPPLHPPELSSPARNPTSASFAHCATRKGCRSCCLVCWKAGLMASIAEIGKQAPRGVHGELAARYSEPRAGSNDICYGQGGPPETFGFFDLNAVFLFTLCTTRRCFYAGRFNYKWSTPFRRDNAAGRVVA